MSACIIHHSITSKCIISLWVHAILMQASQQKDQASNIFRNEKWKYGSDKCMGCISSYFLNFSWINHFWISWIISEKGTILLFWFFCYFRLLITWVFCPLQFLTFFVVVFLTSWPLGVDILNFWPFYFWPQHQIKSL